MLTRARCCWRTRRTVVSLVRAQQQRFAEFTAGAHANCVAMSATKGCNGTRIARQYIDRPPFVITPLLDRTFVFPKALRNLNAERVMHLRPKPLLPTVLVATDGSEEGCFRGVGGLVVDAHSRSRCGVSSQVPPDVVASWPAAEAHIQRVECVAVVITLVLMAPVLAGRHV